MVTGLTLGHTHGYHGNTSLGKTLAIVKLYLIIKYETKEALRDNELFSRVISALRKLIHDVLWVNIKCIKICYKTCKTHTITNHLLFFLFFLSLISRSLSFFFKLSNRISIATVVFFFMFSPLVLSREKTRCENAPV